MDDSLTLLIDSASLIYRAFFSTPDSVRDPGGRLMNAAHGFLSMVARLIEERNPDYICCAADDDWRPQWRVDLIDTYKTQRAEEGSAQSEVEDELEHQMPVIVEVLARCGIPVVGFADYEAEDVIGTLAHRAPGRVEIVSGDRDLFQLVEDPKICVIYPKKGVSVVDRVDEAFIEAKYGIPGRRYLDFAVLRGDPSDGLPGVRGIGEKLASALVAKHGDLDGVIAASQESSSNVLAKVAASLDYIDRARRVATIPTDLPIPVVDLQLRRGIEPGAILELGDANGIGTPVSRLAELLGAAS